MSDGAGSDHEKLPGARIKETVIWTGEYRRIIWRAVINQDGVTIGQVHVPQQRSFDALGNQLGWDTIADIPDHRTRERAYRFCLQEMLETLIGRGLAFIPLGTLEAKKTDDEPDSDEAAQVIAGYYSRAALTDLEETGIKRSDPGDVLVDIYVAYGQFTSQTGCVPDTIFLSRSHLTQACRGTAIWSMSDLDLSSLRLTKILGMRIVEVNIERPMLAVALEASRQYATTAVAAYYHETRQ